MLTKFLLKSRLFWIFFSMISFLMTCQEVKVSKIVWKKAMYVFQSQCNSLCFIIRFCSHFWFISPDHKNVHIFIFLYSLCFDKFRALVQI